MAKLNKRGMELYNKFEKFYYEENNKLGGNSAQCEFVDGWCIIDNNDYIHNIEDECSLLIFGYDNKALDCAFDWKEEYGENEIVISELGFTYGDLYNEMKKYFE